MVSNGSYNDENVNAAAFINKNTNFNQKDTYLTEANPAPPPPFHSTNIGSDRYFGGSSFVDELILISADHWILYVFKASRICQKIHYTIGKSRLRNSRDDLIEIISGNYVDAIPKYISKDDHK